MPAVVDVVALAIEVVVKRAAAASTALTDPAIALRADTTSEAFSFSATDLKIRRLVVGESLQKNFML
jgi:hypothetical protein